MPDIDIIHFCPARENTYVAWAPLSSQGGLANEGTTRPRDRRRDRWAHRRDRARPAWCGGRCRRDPPGRGGLRGRNHPAGERTAGAALDRSSRRGARSGFPLRGQHVLRLEVRAHRRLPVGVRARCALVQRAGPARPPPHPALGCRAGGRKAHLRGHLGVRRGEHVRRDRGAVQRCADRLRPRRGVRRDPLAAAQAPVLGCARAGLQRLFGLACDCAAGTGGHQP
jgi:hypothetical protein